MGWKDTIQEEPKTSWKDSIIDEQTPEDKVLAMGQGPIAMPEEPKSSWKDTIQDEPPNKTTSLDAIAGGITEGGTLGFAGEIMGGVKAVGEKLGLVDTQRSVFDEDTLKAEYQAQRDKHQQYLDTAAQEHPAEFMGGQIVGGVGSSIATGGYGPASIIGRAALEGGVYGLGTSKADLTEGEFGKAAKDTASGALVGTVMPSAIKGMKGAIKYGGKAAIGTTKAIAGLSGKVDDVVVDGASSILGIAKKELTPELVADLKKYGLGKFIVKKEEILRDINAKIKSLKYANQGNTPSYEKALKLKELIEKSDPTLMGQVVREGKKMDPFDVASVAMGPGAYVAKKSRNIISDRLKLKAPEISQKISGIKQGADKFVQGMKEGPSGKAWDSTTGLFTSPAGVRAYTQGTIDINKIPSKYTVEEKVQGTKYQPLFEGLDEHQKAVRNNLLYQQDQEYRMLDKDKEE